MTEKSKNLGEILRACGAQNDKIELRGVDPKGSTPCHLKMIINIIDKTPPALLKSALDGSHWEKEGLF